MAINSIQIGREVDYLPLLPSAAYTSTPDSQQVYRSNPSDGLVVVVDMTAVTATGTVTVKIEGVDPVTNKTWPILTSAALSTAGVTTVLRVHPNLPTSGSVTAQDMVPPWFRVTATHGNGVSMTYSVTAIFTD